MPTPFISKAGGAHLFNRRIKAGGAHLSMIKAYIYGLNILGGNNTTPLSQTTVKGRQLVLTTFLIKAGGAHLCNRRSKTSCAHLCMVKNTSRG
jgi:hypothetical protein